MTKSVYFNEVIWLLQSFSCYPLSVQTPGIFQFLFKIWRYIILFTFIQIVVQSFLILFYHEKAFDLEEDGPVLINCGVYIFVTLTYLLMLVNLPKLVNLVNFINDEFVYTTDNQIEHVSMEEALKWSRRLTRIWTFLTFWASASLATMPLMSGLRILPLKMYWDFTQTPYFELMYLWECLAQILMGLVYGVTDSIYLSIAIMLAQQFQILGNNMKNYTYTALMEIGFSKRYIECFRKSLSNDNHNNVLHLYEHYSDVFGMIETHRFKRLNYEYFKKNIKHHEKLLKAHRDFSDTFEILLLFKLGAVTFYAAFSLFSILTAKSKETAMSFATYGFDACIEMFLYNSPGQFLIESADLAWTVYESPWYLFDVFYRKSFITLQMNIKRTILIKAGGYFIMSLPSYVSFMKMIYSVLTLLLQFTSD